MFQYNVWTLVQAKSKLFSIACRWSNEISVQKPALSMLLDYTSFPLCLTSILVEIWADINYNLIYFVSLVLIEANLNLFELNLRKLSCKPRVMWPIADAITCYLSWNVFMANLPCIWVKVVLFYHLISYSSQPDAIWVECIEQSYWQSLLCWDLPLVETSLMLLFEWLFKQACTNLSLTLSSSIVVDIRS